MFFIKCDLLLTILLFTRQFFTIFFLVLVGVNVGPDLQALFLKVYGTNSSYKHVFSTYELQQAKDSY